MRIVITRIENARRKKSRLFLLKLMVGSEWLKVVRVIKNGCERPAVYYIFDLTKEGRQGFISESLFIAQSGQDFTNASYLSLPNASEVRGSERIKLPIDALLKQKDMNLLLVPKF